MCGARREQFNPLVPAKAGTQSFSLRSMLACWISRLRGNERRRSVVRSKQIEILVVLPGGDIRLAAGLRGEAREFRLFDVREIIDKGVAEAFAEHGASPQRADRFAEIFRQRRRFGLVRRIGRW